MQQALETALTTQTMVGELTSWEVFYDVETKGVAVAKLFEENPQVPGIIVTERGRRIAALSQTQFLRTIGRPFGIEIFYGRPLSAFRDASDIPMLELPAFSSIPDAVIACLARGGSMMYEPFLAVDAGDERVRMVDFRTLIIAASDVAALRSQQMERILSSVGEGLLTIDPDFMIGHEYSSVLESIFETKQIGDRPLLDLLASVLTERNLTEAKDYLAVLFNPRMIDRLIETVNPIKEVEARFPSADGTEVKVKNFTIRFRRIKVGGKITQVLMRVEDITKNVTLAKELERQAADTDVQAQFFGEILQNDPEELAGFLKTFDRYVVECVEWVQPNFNGQPAKERANQIYGLIHALKGEAGLLKLKEFRTLLHRFEEDIRRVSTRDLDAVEDSLSPLLPGLVELTNLSEETKERIYKLRGLAAAFKAKEEPEFSGNSSAKTVGIIAPLSRLVNDLAKELNREVAFHCVTPEEVIPPHYATLFRETVLQLARNSLVHGIEDREERIQFGKTPTANLQFAVRPTEDGHWLEAVFQDDGRGLNEDRIREKLRSLGWPEDYDPAEAIFTSGFSTAEETTMEAGRGVGLDYLKRSVEEVGGCIRVHYQPGLYCAFQILVPASENPLTPADHSNTPQDPEGLPV
jgi:two-component system chemotaxis sensor kinase CheA